MGARELERAPEARTPGALPIPAARVEARATAPAAAKAIRQSATCGAGDRLRALVPLLVLPVLLVGCAEPQPAPAHTPGVNLSGYSAEFKAGYADGCASVSRGMQRDPQRYRQDARYAQGWRDGYAICGRR